MRETMKLILGAALLSASTVTKAAASDGPAPLLCTVTHTVNCDSGGSETNPCTAAQ